MDVDAPAGPCGDGAFSGAIAPPLPPPRAITQHRNVGPPPTSAPDQRETDGPAPPPPTSGGPVSSSYHPGAYAVVPSPKDKREEALHDLLERFSTLKQLAALYSGCLTRETVATINNVDRKLGLEAALPPLSVLAALLESVLVATEELEERANFLSSYLKEGCCHVGRGDDGLLDKLLRSHPEEEIFLFHFNYTERDETTTVWKLFHHLLAYRKHKGNSQCVLVRSVK